VDSRLALCIPNGFKCEGTLNIGIFFDGTDNNRRRKEEVANPKLNTNITRLWQIYKERRSVKGLCNANARHRVGPVAAEDESKEVHKHDRVQD
jgi:hypothetical protein